MSDKSSSKPASTSKQTPFQLSLNEATSVFHSLAQLENSLERAVHLCTKSLSGGHKLLACGNGGSACDAQHLVGELIGRYKDDRRSFPAVALTADSSVLTCIGNDYGFDAIFARQVKGLGSAGDVLVVFSTSGRSPNVVQSLQAARETGVTSIAFLGRDGGPAAALADLALIVPHSATARIQEAHHFLIHALMDGIEEALFPAT